ncbi:BMC domain-containing protein [Clostridium sp. CCUG 7971]|uniref:BMC domain-containing protein n=1 Tax=Clostridium sp. CCUG 7971 TaxID=2811414 RepID=UPI001ABA9BE8|nr:BMC domain-containing protein [Clostridium sp. CCUG 7971]MBO3443120.1 BMC domain-containing protein [Clostridium sp. CCUG 7971]
MINALGLVETIGYVAAIEALDVCLKSASVKVVGIQKVGQGIVTIEVTGDVGAVKSAVEAASDAVGRIGTLRATHVIPRLHNDVYETIFKKEEAVFEENTQVEVQEDIVKKETQVEIQETSIEENTQVEISKNEKIEKIKETIEVKKELPEASSDKKVRPNLSKLSVKELKNLAKSLESKMTYKELNSLKKEDLISLVDKFYREDE